MKTLSRTALIASLAAALGATALAPVYAQGPSNNKSGPGFGIQHIEGGAARAFRPGGDQHRQMNHPGILAELVTARNAEGIDVAAVRLTHRLNLTETQAALLDKLKIEALSSQSDLAAARESIMPITESDAERPDITARYAGMVAMTTARAEALTALQPAFEAFVESLTADQLALLDPSPRMPGHNGPGGFAQRPHG